MATTATGDTKHTCTDDGSALPFGRKAPEGECARCDELRNGASARTPAWVERKQSAAQQDADRKRAIDRHFAPGGPHARGVCGPVCTAFDW